MTDDSGTTLCGLRHLRGLVRSVSGERQGTPGYLVEEDHNAAGQATAQAWGNGLTTHLPTPHVRCG